MKQFLSWIGKRIINGIVTGIFLIVTVLGIVYAINYPSTPPTGEITGGKFMAYFNKMLVNTGTTTDGTVHKSLTTEQIGALTEGKWCTASGSKIDCTSSAPIGIGGGGIVPQGGVVADAYRAVNAGSWQLIDGTSSWTAPPGVTSVVVSMIGGGAVESLYWHFVGTPGNGGRALFITSVIPGQTYAIVAAPKVDCATCIYVGLSGNNSSAFGVTVGGGSPGNGWWTTGANGGITGVSTYFTPPSSIIPANGNGLGHTFDGDNSALGNPGSVRIEW
ncbi:MAG: hypothetical protein PHN60_02615 [Candidatus Gracilibacteria bacterium]|nr:hypothetical protein [Candidatus Gracilibacteria bacterium]